MLYGDTCARMFKYETRVSVNERVNQRCLLPTTRCSSSFLILIRMRRRVPLSGAAELFPSTISCKTTAQGRIRLCLQDDDRIKVLLPGDSEY
ncbi:hypothetical protein CDAR_42311 [Caerostris darwini]|uniref:Uncharacterized protein n=1 Tax=Caerostris darwini TaxID=1538125 RepID=A0AAV4RFI8_9ARAC|nr:hypothetical protein CDAR_42311 [Caerostris darwini]